VPLGCEELADPADPVVGVAPVDPVVAVDPLVVALLADFDELPQAVLAKAVAAATTTATSVARCNGTMSPPPYLRTAKGPGMVLTIEC
jgi:hypothetical protein